MNSLRQLRKRSGMTLAELAQKTGASISLLSKFERGERTINGRWVKALANAMSINESDITGGNVVNVITPEQAPWWFGLKQIDIDTSDMDRVIPHNSTLYVDPSAGVEDHGIYVVRIGNEEMVRRVRTHGGPMRFEPDSWSGTHDTIFMGAQPVEIVGRVRGAVLGI